jgi:hypothetical protein
MMIVLVPQHVLDQRGNEAASRLMRLAIICSVLLEMSKFGIIEEEAWSGGLLDSFGTR